MEPILFWLLGVVSLLAGLLAIFARKPARAVQALVVILGASAIIALLAGSVVLGSEMILVSLGAGLMVWTILIRGKKLRLGTPGRARLNVTRLVALFVAIWLGSLFLWALFNSSEASGPLQPRQPLEAGFGLWAALILISSAAATAWMVVSARRKMAAEEDES